jgi:gamma-glutamyltranspeptidase/glutathione hydrolase
MFVGPDGEYSPRLHHRSHVAVGVPGTVAGFDQAHRLWGTLPWERLVYPAVALAQDGFPVSERLAGSLADLVESTEYPATAAAFSRGGTPLRPGDTLRQPDLAATLGRIMRERRDGFYRGETARLLVDEMERGGGLITLDDLEAYQARERTPIRGSYRGYEVVTMPPPSSGGVALVTMLNVLEGFDLAGAGQGTARNVHLLAEAMRRAYRDRALHVADPDRVDVPIHALTSKAHADELRATIDPARASVSSPADVETATHESLETTHYSVVDRDGLAVAVTYTLEAGFGSKITVPGAGFLLNNEMGDFNAAPGLTDDDGLIGTEPNLARPGQRMLSSMTPTILARDGELVAVLGSPGGRTIINTVLQLVVGLVDHGLDLPAAVAAGRVHHQWLPDRIVAEEEALGDATVEALEAMGHRVVVRGRQGLAHVIWIDPATGERVGQPDARNPDAGAAGHR